MMRQTPSWRKLALLGQMNQTVKELALSYPHANESELSRRLADLVLGSQLAERVYGPLDRIE
jgi:hypothetical protein